MTSNLSNFLLGRPELLKIKAKTEYIIVFSWIINYNFLQIEYKNNEICSPKEAKSARIKFSFEDGGIKKYLKSREMIECWAYDTYKERSEKIIQGKY